MKKICIISPDMIGPITNGGVGTACFWQARTYRNAGHDVSVLFTGQTETKDASFWESYYNDHFSILYIDLNKYIESTHPEIWKSSIWPNSDELRNALYVLEFLKGSEHFDVIFFQDYLGHGIRALQYKKCGLGLQDTICVTTLHSSHRWIRQGMQCVSYTREEAMLDFIEQESARLSDFTIAPSLHMSDWAQAHMKLSSKPVRIPYCFGCDSDEGGSKSFAGFKHLIFFGRLETRKGLHLFLEALPPILIKNLIDKVSFVGKIAKVNGRNSGDMIRALFNHFPGVEYEILGEYSSDEAWQFIESQQNVLIVAPSIVDNLPLTIIELYTRKVPFISTKIGGIPEIVGENNQLLCEPSSYSLQEKLMAIVQLQNLSIDYNTGFSPKYSAAKHLEFINTLNATHKSKSWTDTEDTLVSIIIPHYNCAQLLKKALISISNQESVPFLEVIVCDDGSNPEQLELYRSLRKEFNQFIFLELPENSGPSVARNFSVQHAKGDFLLFFDADNEAKSHMVKTFYEGMLSAGYDCLTCFNHTVHEDGIGFSNFLSSGSTGQIHAPLGAAVEAGIILNVFGDTCSIVKRTVFDQIGGFKKDCGVEDWVFFASLIFNGYSLGTIPDALYYYSVHADSNFHATTSYQKCQDVIDCYSQQKAIEYVNWRLVLEWLYGREERDLRHHSGDNPEKSSYFFFSNMDEKQLFDYLNANRRSDFLPKLDGDLAQIHKKLVKEESSIEGNRIYIYGAGQHTKALLGSFPKLYDAVSGFIDRSAIKTFLGKPVYLPDNYSAKDGDVIIYSSKTAEKNMYERMKHLPIKHILLYK